jgi:DNA-binding NtrC family response regulator
MKTKNQMNIFIVEDNKVFTMALKADIETSFANMHIKIHTFETGEACMEKFKEERPQVVILDFHLNNNNPDAVDGIKVLDWIKKESFETSVIMLTRDDNIEIAIKSFRHMASDYIVKSETIFRKINYSLLHIFKMMEAKSDARRYKNMVIGIVLCVALVIIGVTLIQIINPFFLNR